MKALILANIEASNQPYLTKVRAIQGVYLDYGYETRVIVRNFLRVPVVRSTNLYCASTLAKFYWAFLRAVVLDHVDIVQIRHPRLNPLLILILLIRRIKHGNSVRTIMEVPTFPVEFGSGFKEGLLKFLDSMSRPFAKACFNLVLITGTKASYAYGLPAISIINGFSGNKSDLNWRQPPRNRNQIRMIFCGFLAERHALDRVIEGLEIYFQQDHPSFDITMVCVGSGHLFEKFKQQVQNSELLKGVIVFKNPMYGAELSELISSCHIGIGNLGFHRIGVADSFSLKEVDYFVRGLSVIRANRHPNPNLNKHTYVAGNSDEPLNILDLTNWYTNFKCDRNFIQSCALNYYDWNNVYKPVFDKIRIMNDDH